MNDNQSLHASSVPIAEDAITRTGSSKHGHRFLAETKFLVPVLLITVGYGLVAIICATILDWPMDFPVGTMARYVAAMIGLFISLGIALVVPVLTIILVTRAVARALGYPPPFNIRLIPKQVFAPRRWAAVLALFALYIIFISIFIGFKQAIPAVVPFYGDVPFMKIDRWLHFGHDPWRLLHPILGIPVITKALDVLYYVWFPLNLVCLIGFVWVRDRMRRLRFFLSFWLVWLVLGTIMAYAFSSAGPCYFASVTDRPDPYASLLQYLVRVDHDRGLMAIMVQSKLWSVYLGDDANVVVKGISAMPSLHVALPALYTIATWGMNRALSAAFGVFTFLILLGSVHLAWHYAIDGYVAIIAVAALWPLTAFAVRGNLEFE